jgi:hypothetical protein
VGGRGWSDLRWKSKRTADALLGGALKGFLDKVDAGSVIGGLLTEISSA